MLGCAEWRGMRQNLFDDSDVLEDAQDLVVERHGARDFPDGAAFLKDDGLDAHLPQPAGRHSPHGTEPHDRNIEVFLAGVHCWLISSCGRAKRMASWALFTESGFG